MALLAENKRKIKYGLDPRNTNWINDETKIGQKLMEKMGWSKGKGLGANEDGDVNAVKASYKSDSRGLGSTVKDADAWIAHQDDFNDLLKNLNAESGGQKQQDKTDLEKTDGRKRYYGRFARGNVPTLRSIEDLDCIFGKRKGAATEKQDDEEADKDDSSERRHGLTTTTSTSSVQEYFAQKMAAKKKGTETSAGSQQNELSANNSDSVDSDSKSGQQKDESERAPAVFGTVGFSYDEVKVCEETVQDIKTDCGEENTNRKSKKRKRNKTEDCSSLEVTVNEGGPGLSNDISEPQMKKRKKNVRFQLGDDDSSSLSPEEEQSVTKEEETNLESRKKKKKKKRGTKEKDEESAEVSSEDVKRIKKSKKDKAEEETDMVDQDALDISQLKKKKKKKGKKSESCDSSEQGENNNVDEENLCEVSDKKKKRKKKNMEVEDVNKTDELTEDATPIPLKEKSKKKKEKRAKEESPESTLETVEASEENTEEQEKARIEKKKAKNEKKMAAFNEKGKKKKKKKKMSSISKGEFKSEKEALKNAFVGSNITEIPGYLHGKELKDPRVFKS